MKTRILLMSFSLIALICSCGKQKPAEVVAADTTAVANTVTLKIIHAKVFVKPEKVADFIAAARIMVDSSNMEPGCMSYQLYQDPYDNTRFIFVEEWKDQAAIDAHFNMSYFKAWGPKSADWLSGSTELKIFEASQQE